MRLLLSLFFSVFVLQLFSQSVPGYLGHRFVISYEPHVFPSLENPNSEDYQAESTSFSLNLQHHLRVDWMLNKKFSLGLDAGYFKTHFLVKDFYFENYNSDMVLPLNGFNAAGVLRWHRNHYAPLGKYFEIKIGTIGYRPTTLIYQALAGEMIIPSEINYAPYAGIGFGLNHVFFDRMMLSIGADMNYVIGGLNNAFTMLKEPEMNSLTMEQGNGSETLADLALGRAFTHYLFNFKIGIGYLL